MDQVNEHEKDSGGQDKQEEVSAWDMKIRDGICFPSLPTGRNTSDNIDGLPNFKLRDDDILITAYPKSGTHWINEIIGMLLQGSAQPLNEEKESSMIEFHSFDYFNELPSPRILNTHYWAQHIPMEMLKKCKLFHVMRNPKDVAVSGYFHARMWAGKCPFRTFRDCLDIGLEGKAPRGSWFEHERQYEKLFKENPELDPLCLYYEDMIKDPMGSIKNVAAHIEKSYDDEFYSKVLDACHIDKMREYAKSRTKGDWFRTETVKGRIYRKGKIGDWKNHFTVADNELFEKVYKEKMEGSSLKFQFE